MKYIRLPICPKRSRNINIYMYSLNTCPSSMKKHYYHILFFFFLRVVYFRERDYGEGRGQREREERNRIPAEHGAQTRCSISQP